MNSVANIFLKVVTEAQSRRLGYFFVISSAFLQLIIFPVVARAQSNIGYEANAFSGAAVSRVTSTFRYNQNPAAHSIGVNWFGIQSFGMTDLREMGISMGINRKQLHSGLELHHFGFDLFNETKIYTGVSISFSNHTLGISLGGMQSAIKGYGRANSLLTGAGFITKVTETIKVGGAVSDIPVWTDGDFILDSRYVSRFGAEFSIREHTKVYTTVTMIAGLEPNISLALESTFLEKIQVSAGYKTVVEEWSGGLKVDVNRIVIYLCSKKHPFLGWSPGGGFGIKW